VQFAYPDAVLFVDVASIHDLPLRRAKTVLVGDRRIALYHTDSGFFASDNTCPHRGGPLGEGDIIGEEIICPWHLWGFEVDTGYCTGNPRIRIAIHEVRIEGGRVLVQLSEEGMQREP